MLVWMLVVVVRHGEALISAMDLAVHCCSVCVVMGELGVLPVFFFDAAVLLQGREALYKGAKGSFIALYHDCTILVKVDGQYPSLLALIFIFKDLNLPPLADSSLDVEAVVL